MATQLAQDIYENASAEECDVAGMRGLCSDATKEDVNWHNPAQVSWRECVLPHLVSFLTSALRYGKSLVMHIGAFSCH